ncbi:hypothetical protein GCM10018965_047160 [Nonomuraea roseola]
METVARVAARHQDGHPAPAAREMPGGQAQAVGGGEGDIAGTWQHRAGRGRRRRVGQVDQPALEDPDQRQQHGGHGQDGERGLDHAGPTNRAMTATPKTAARAGTTGSILVSSSAR